MKAVDAALAMVTEPKVEKGWALEWEAVDGVWNQVLWMPEGSLEELLDMATDPEWAGHRTRVIRTVEEVMYVFPVLTCKTCKQAERLLHYPYNECSPCWDKR